MTHNQNYEDNEYLEHGLTGVVIAVQANFYQVKFSFEKGDRPSTLLCTRRILLKKIGQKVMVGDRVRVEEADWIEGRGVIAEVFPRKTELDRPPVANGDQILLVFAVDEPPLEPWQVSRFLVKAESTGLDLCLCLNKSDLITVETQKYWENRLKSWGYDPIFISVEKNQGLDLLLERLKDKITIVAGPSGVGKSSLINRLIPNLKLRVNAVSGKLQKGRHTTRHVELFELKGGGLLADTPGFNQPMLNCEPQELIYYFPEVKERLEGERCQFNNCLHRDEPFCVIRGDWERYEFYLKFLEEVTAFQEKLLNSTDQDQSLKVKIKESGHKKYEPRLETKKYRRETRKKKNQKLEDFEVEIDPDDD